MDPAELRRAISRTELKPPVPSPKNDVSIPIAHDLIMNTIVVEVATNDCPWSWAKQRLGSHRSECTVRLNVEAIDLAEQLDDQARRNP